MRKFLLAVFITFIVSIGIFGYFHHEDRSQEIIDTRNQTSYTEL